MFARIPRQNVALTLARAGRSGMLTQPQRVFSAKAVNPADAALSKRGAVELVPDRDVESYPCPPTMVSKAKEDAAFDAWHARDHDVPKDMKGKDMIISPLGDYGWYPLLGLGLTAAVSKELLLIDDNLYAVANFAIVSGVFFVHGADAVHNAFYKQYIDETDKLVSGGRLLTKVVGQARRVEEFWFKEAEVLEKYNTLYQKACKDVQAALRIQGQQEVRTHLVKEMDKVVADELAEEAKERNGYLQSVREQVEGLMDPEANPSLEAYEAEIKMSMERAINDLAIMTTSVAPKPFQPSAPKDDSAHAAFVATNDPQEPAYHVRSLFVRAMDAPVELKEVQTTKIVADYLSVPEGLDGAEFLVDAETSTTEHMWGAIQESHYRAWMAQMREEGMSEADLEAKIDEDKDAGIVPSHFHMDPNMVYEFEYETDAEAEAEEETKAQ